MTERSAPSLVDLAHAAEQAIAHLVAVDEDGARSVGTDKPWSSDARPMALYAANRALMALRWRFADGGDVPVEYIDIHHRITNGIVRPEWGLRVVQIAAAEQARRDGTNYCAACDKRGVIVDDDGRHTKCGGKVEP